MGCQGKKLQLGGEDAIEDYGDDEYLDNADDADIGDMLTLPRQREERDDDVSLASDDVSSDVISVNDDEGSEGDRNARKVEQMREDFEKFRKMRKEKEKFKVRSDCRH